MKIDLHLHSTASDGLLHPQQLVSLLSANGVARCALTDHDTMHGLPRALEAASAAGIELWPGVELSTEDGAEVHVLGYFPMIPAEMRESLESLRQMRIERLGRIVGALCDVGVALELADIACEPGASPGRMHVARALVARGFAPNLNEAFKRYLVQGRPGYVAREKYTPQSAIALIREHGGLPVLAHPGIIQAGGCSLPARMSRYVRAGLMGIEVYHPRHTPAQRGMLRRFAAAHGLVVTGGSDYHGVPGAAAPGDGTIDWDKAEEDYAEFLAKLMRQS